MFGRIWSSFFEARLISILSQRGVGRDRAVRYGLGVTLGVAVGVGVMLSVGVGLGVAVGVTVGVGVKGRSSRWCGRSIDFVSAN